MRRNASRNCFCINTALPPPFSSHLLIFRFFTGSFASAPNALVAGILSDIYGDPRSRGRAMAWFMAVSRTFYISPLVLDANGSSSDYRMGPPLRPDYIGLLFDHHRVPHSAMLSRYSKVDLNTGAYSKPANPAVVYGSLTYVRAQIIMHARLIIARAVTIAVRYASVRRQFQSPYSAIRMLQFRRRVTVVQASYGKNSSVVLVRNS